MTNMGTSSDLSAPFIDFFQPLLVAFGFPLRAFCPVDTAACNMQARTLEKITNILIEQLSVDPGDVCLEARFVEDLGADSLDIVAVISAIEREWNLEIDDSTAERVSTVAEAVALIEEICR